MITTRKRRTVIHQKKYYDNDNPDHSSTSVGMNHPYLTGRLFTDPHITALPSVIKKKAKLSFNCQSSESTECKAQILKTTHILVPVDF